MARFLHVDEKPHPRPIEHPTQGALPDLKLLFVPVVTRVASPLAGAIDEIAIAKPATKSNEAFIAMSSQKLGREMPIPEGKIARLRYGVESAPGLGRVKRVFTQPGSRTVIQAVAAHGPVYGPLADLDLATTVPIRTRSQFANAFPSRIEQLAALGCRETTS